MRLYAIPSTPQLNLMNGAIGAMLSAIVLSDITNPLAGLSNRHARKAITARIAEKR